jgi:hypothetical protein
MPPIHEALAFPNDEALAAYFVVCLNEYGQINEIRKFGPRGVHTVYENHRGRFEFDGLVFPADPADFRGEIKRMPGCWFFSEQGLLTVARFINLLYTILIFFDPLTFIQLFESNRSEKEKWMLSSPRLDQCLSVLERRK